MSWSKGQIVAEAFGELALAGFDFDITPEEEQSALRQLEGMMAAWAEDGIRLGYVFASDPAAINAQQDSGLPLSAIEAVYLNLAARRAAGFGKQLQGRTLATAREGLARLQRAAVYPPQQQMPSGVPAGAGNRPWRTHSPYLIPPDTGPTQIAEDGGLDFRS